MATITDKGMQTRSTARGGRPAARRDVVAGLALTAALTAASAADVNLQAANLDNPYFPDRPPTAAPGPDGHYTLAPAPRRLFGLQGDTVPVAFTVVSSAAQTVTLSAGVFEGNNAVAGTEGGSKVRLALLHARDVTVEGNSNGNCSCPAGQLPQQERPDTRAACVPVSSASDRFTPKGCPAADERARAATVQVRTAPFAIKDPLEPAPAGQPLEIAANATELFVVEVPIEASLPKGNLEVRITAKPASGAARTIAIPLRVLSTRLEGFPEMDVSYWLSEDPRDLAERPGGTPLTGRWGGEWWGEEHWQHIERAARLQASLGVTSTLVPLFVRNPFGVDAKPLVGVRCITGSDAQPKDFEAAGGRPSAFNGQVEQWRYDFDFSGFRRWITTFRNAGFRQFEGAHLFANGGELPVVLTCDLYRNAGDATPYARGFQFMPRAGGPNEDPGQHKYRQQIYKEKFLPAFLDKLMSEVKQAGIERNFVQHVIDENEASDAAMAAYADGVRVVRAHLPGIRTMDSINKFTAAKYRGLADVPVFHLGIIYDDQGRRPGIRKEVDSTFQEQRKYFYNTALHQGGPNRFIDTNPMESRTYGWLALETGYNGFLYWASNSYRYPARELPQLNRPDDWTPYRFSLGPLPGGYIAPAEAAGSNWDLYPTPQGLIGSVRALRLREGLVDHWLYLHAWTKCQGAPACRNQLLDLRKRISGDPMIISDYSRNPADYDEAREVMVRVLEP